MFYDIPESKHGLPSGGYRYTIVTCFCYSDGRAIYSGRKEIFPW